MKIEMDGETVVIRVEAKSVTIGVDSEEHAKLKGALAMAQNSREFNRKRVVELEEEVARLTREHSGCPGRLELRERDADTFRRQRDQLEIKMNDLQSQIQHLRDRATDEDHRSALQIDEVANPLRAQIKELEGDGRSELINRVRELEEHNTRLTRQLSDAIKERTAILARNRNLRTEVERLESVRDHHTRTHRESLAARDRLLSQAQGRIYAAKQVLTHPSVADAKENLKGMTMADTIDAAVAALEA